VPCQDRRTERTKSMSDLIKYDLPRVVVRAARKYLGADRQPFGDYTTIYTYPVSPGGQVWPVGLEIDAEVAPHLLVNDVKVGRNSQLVACGSVPATLFASSLPVNLRFDRLRAGQIFSIHVSCLGPDDVEFRGRLLAAAPGTPVPERSWVAGFGYTEVRAGQTVTLVTTPMVEFRVRRLHVPPHLLDVFRVDSLFQGPYLDVPRTSHVVDSLQLGRENLSRGGEIFLDPFQVVGIGQPVTMEVTNTSDTTQFFSAALLGEAVEVSESRLKERRER
jgi:hypothetical protein